MILVRDLSKFSEIRMRVTYATERRTFALRQLTMRNNGPRLFDLNGIPERQDSRFICMFR
jgi:hypothetical protein